MDGHGLRNLGIVAALALAAAVVLGGLASGVAAEGTTVGIDSFEAQVEFEGKTKLWADELPEAGLGAWTIDITYDPEVAAVVECDAEHGGVCNGGYKANKIRVTGISAFGLQKEATLAAIYFVCVKPGESDLELSLSVFADATAGDPQTIDAKVKHGSIKCTEEPPKPTPTEEPKPTPTLEKEGQHGDADCSGDVDAVDAIYILQYEAHLLDEIPCHDNADVNKDDEINSIDAILVLQMQAGLI